MVFASITGIVWAIILVGVLAYQRNTVSTAETWVTHTHQVLQTTKNLDTDIQRLIAHQRGFLITRDKTFLEIFEQEKQNILRNIIVIAGLTRDNSEQANRLADLQSEFMKLADLLEERARSNGKSLMPWQVQDTENLKGIDRNIDIILEGIIKYENDLLTERLHVEKTHKELYDLSINIGILVTIALILALNLFIWRLNHQRRHAELESQDMQDRFALAMRSTADGVFDWDMENNTVYYSPRFKQMLGLRDEEMENSLEAFNALVHPEDLNSMWAYANHYLSGQLSEYSTIFRMKHNSGGWVWIHCRARGVFNNNGKAIRLIGAHTDVTQLKEIEEKLKIEKEIAVSASRAKSEFLANMSHEIRTPLNAVIGVSNILARGNTLSQAKRDNLLSTLQSSSNSLLELINNVLDFAKIESGELEIQKEDFQLPKVLEEVMDMMDIKAKEKKITLTIDHSRLVQTQHKGDAMRLKQILINLVGNAIKFTTEGSVHVSARHENNLLLIEVQDTGIGISEEYQEKIFNKFDQADGSITRKFGGTGLGLAISKQLADLMGGAIIVESKLDKGSTFTLQLPATIESVAAKPAEPAELSAAPSLGKPQPVATRKKISSRKKILIAEDYQGNIIVIKFLLDNLGVKYDIANDGAEAVKMHKKSPYPLILMDIQMPRMDGFQATRAIRDFETETGRSPCTIIAMTAHALAGDSERCLKSGMDDYLAKPLTEKDIRDKFELHLAKSA